MKKYENGKHAAKTQRSRSTLMCCQMAQGEDMAEAVRLAKEL